MRRVLLCLALFFASPLYANSKSLFVNGVYAALYGDLGYDKGDWRGNNYSAPRIKAGIQLLRIDFVSLTVGYQKVGFYDGAHKWTGDEKITFDYRGPVVELHAFPDAPFGFSFALASGSGFSYRKAAVFPNITPSPAGSIKGERSDVDVSEFTGYVTAKVAYGLQLFLGAGTRTVKGTIEYQVDRAGVHTFEKNPNGKDWSESNGIFLVGLRGTTL